MSYKGKWERNGREQKLESVEKMRHTSWLFNGWQRNQTTNKHLDTFLMVRPSNLYHRKNL
jgi:agmatine/peptidylarginine deiminase